MIVRNQKNKALRTLLACGASLVAMAVAPAHAQQREEQAVYMLRYATEIADGDSVLSQSRDILTARKRSGDRSVLVYDEQNGRMTIERMGKTLILPLISTSGPNRAYAYDYKQQTLNGDNLIAANFNVTVRPLLANGPVRGSDARWSVRTNLKQLALAARTDGDIVMNLTRTYFENKGKPVVLVEFDIPAFTYVANKGETVVHWAHGFAVADPGFGEVHAFATQHRASAMSPDGVMRPISVSTSIHGIDADGKWRMSFAQAPQVLAAMRRVVETEGASVHPTTSTRVDVAPDSFPVRVAAQLDFVAFGVLEGGANPLGTMSGGPVGGMGNIFDQLDFPIDELMTAAGTTPDLSDAYRDLMNAANPGNASGPSSPELEALRREQIAQIVRDGREIPVEAIQRLSINGVAPDATSSSTTAAASNSSPIGHMGPLLDGLGFGPPGPGSPPNTVNIRDFLLEAASDIPTFALPNLPFVLSPDGQVLVDEAGLPPPRPAGTVSAHVMRLIEERRRSYDASVEDFSDMVASLEDVFAADGPGDTAGERDDQALDVSLSDAEDASARAMRAMLEAREDERDAGTLDPRLQSSTSDNLVDAPGWIEPNSEDAEAHRLLVEEMQKALKAARDAAEKKKADAAKTDEAADNDGSGLGSSDDFYKNNAFKFDNMVGKVPTDLTRWSAWLRTQNVRELERLALQAGYPNLASALNDAKNILRQSQDRGYRDWAMQAPACGGYIGCGPNYLERWAMKQAIVILGDILNDSRDIFSTGGFSDIGISGLNLAYLLRDHATEDGDLVRVRISQFGKLIYEGQISLTNAGLPFNLNLQRGVASVEIFAVNEGALPPNTAQITVDDVVRGQATQTYSLQTGDTATLRVEAGAKPSAAMGGSGVGQ